MSHEIQELRELITQGFAGVNQRIDELTKNVDSADKRIDQTQEAVVNVNKRLTVIEKQLTVINLKIDEIREWTQLDLKDNPFLKRA